MTELKDFEMWSEYYVIVEAEDKVNKTFSYKNKKDATEDNINITINPSDNYDVKS